MESVHGAHKKVVDLFEVLQDYMEWPSPRSCARAAPRGGLAHLSPPDRRVVGTVRDPGSGAGADVRVEKASNSGAASICSSCTTRPGPPPALKLASVQVHLRPPEVAEAHAFDVDDDRAARRHSQHHQGPPCDTESETASRAQQAARASRRRRRPQQANHLINGAR
jgi:hypothetical protein